MQEKPFIHLHCHSHYSFLDGLSKIPDLVARAKGFGMNALALTDHGNMHGAIEFYKTCTKSGIKPIIGCEIYMAERSRFDKIAQIDDKRYHLTLLARNTVGYKNLMKLVSKAQIEGFYYKPRADMDLLREYTEGLICLSGCPGGRFIRYLKNGNATAARELLQEYISIFGREYVFLEVMWHSEIEWYIPLIPEIQKISIETGIPLVATWDSHYLDREDKAAHQTLVDINTGNSKKLQMTGDYSFISPDDAYEIFKDISEAVENTQKVADLVEEYELDILEIGDKKPKWYFPIFPLPDGITADQALREKAYAGLTSRRVEMTNDVQKRIDYELEVIQMKGYPSYFLCVADFMEHARKNGILGCARGSAGGSMISYLTGISTLNPMQYGLLFERFLNPGRPSLPDIDMDFADNRRDDIITYAKQKYGENAVAQVGTFGTMAARGAVRDVARALGYPYSLGDRLSKLIPTGAQGFSMTIKKALEIEPDLKKAYEEERQAKEIIDMAKKIEGCVRHVSVHAAGVIISPTGDVTDFTPIQWDAKAGDKIITQYDMYTGDREGVTNLPKFDFLGIRQFSIVSNALDRIEKIRGIKLAYDDILDDDRDTYKMISAGRTVGVFQFASDGMRRWIKDLKPENLEELTAMAALYRPGPMAFIPDYIERKFDPSKVTYMDPRLEPILKGTYGIIIYQEQILLIATGLAKYSWAEADKFRKAVGKKLPEEMKKQKEKFTEGCISSDMTLDATEKLWEMIETFAAYGFVKAHAALYSQLAYRTAYLKCHYTPEYLTAIMAEEADNLDTIAETIEEARSWGYTILLPDVNESFSDFTVVVENGEITRKLRFGLRSIKNFGEDIGKAIIHERKKSGKFTSLEDFLWRVTHKNISKKSLEALIMSGAFDAFGERGQMVASMDEFLAYHKTAVTEENSTGSLFDSIAITRPILRLIDTLPASLSQKLIWEKDLLGLYISGHPLDPIREKVIKNGTLISTIQKIQLKEHWNTVILACVVESIRTMYTKKGEKMSLIKVSDFTGIIEVALFPKNFKEYFSFFKEGDALVIKGEINERADIRSVTVREVKKIDL